MSLANFDGIRDVKQTSSAIGPGIGIGGVLSSQATGVHSGLRHSEARPHTEGGALLYFQ
ncbi:hypothetical protein [Ottowia sp.]|uniref:hypothetical protein n=1 Tax=Ottowia sp. TaxID=1898956 RepID=UPI002D1FA59D|nr:hypothetical protein [Ottowia sp.]